MLVAGVLYGGCQGTEEEKTDLVHQTAEEDGDVFDVDILEDWVILLI